MNYRPCLQDCCHAWESQAMLLGPPGQQLLVNLQRKLWLTPLLLTP